MTKVKEKLYEHRYGFMFFAYLMCFGLILTNGFSPSLDEYVSYSIYAVDFSVGFCTRLLPGAIFNFFFKDVNLDTVTFYYLILVVLCFFLIAVAAEKAVKAYTDNEKAICVTVVMFLLSFFCISAVNGISVKLLDLHWFFSVALFILCLFNKRLYIFIPFTFIYALMCHNGCAFSYIPMFVLMLIYKIICCEDKKEKRYILSVLSVSLFLSVGLFIYMTLFETGNVRYETKEEFIEYLKSKGVTSYHYYVYQFFRENTEGLVIDPTNGNTQYNIIEVDDSQSELVMMIQTVLQQIQVNWFMADHKDGLIKSMSVLPSLIYIFSVYFKMLTEKTVDKIKKFVYVNSILLFFAVIAFGLLFSTDTLRWIMHATMIMTILFLYNIIKDKAFREKNCNMFRKIPSGVIIVLFILCSNEVFR